MTSSPTGELAGRSFDTSPYVTILSSEKSGTKHCMFLNLVLLLAGFVTLIKGADYMVNGASSMAKRMRVSSLVIGLTIVSFGTSAPELTVNIINSINHRNEAIFGNIIGSNIFNLLCIMGITGMIYPLVVQRNSIRYEVPLSLAAIVMLWLFVNDGLLWGSSVNVLSRWESMALLLGFVFFMFYVYRSMKATPDASDEDIKEYPVATSLGLVALGISMLVGGGYLVTENAVSIAQSLGLSEKLIGLTILSVGTSLPELATSVMAAYKKNTGIAIGNIVGSNILNIFLIAGVNGLIQPIEFSPVLNEDLYVLTFATLALLASMFTLSRNKLDRWEAFIFLVCYVAYTGYLIVRN